MNQILNTGIDINIWWTLLKVILLLLMGASVLWKAWKAYKAYEKEEKYKAHIVGLVFQIGAFILIFVFLFIAFGPGRRLPSSEDPVPLEQVKDLPNEDSKEEIKMDALKSRPEVLKRQDSNFVKEAQEADEYIKKALENNK